MYSKFALITIFLFWMNFGVESHAQTCQYLAYEGFGNNANLRLDGSSGGTGWNAAWEVQNHNQEVPGYQFSGTNSLPYTGLQKTGNYISGGKSYLTAGRPLDNRTDGSFANYINNGSIGKDGTVLWTSCLLQKNTNDDEPIFMALHNENVVWYVRNDWNVSVGYFGSASNVGGQKRWSLRIDGTVYPTSTPITLGTPAFFVLKIDFAQVGSTIKLYLNPTTLGVNIPTSPTLTQNYTNSAAHTALLQIRSVGVYLGNDPSKGACDEIRFATTYQCVAPDASTAINTPPTARITANISDGSLPLTVHLDGSTSSDAEGAIAKYKWNFGNGQVDSSGAMVSPVFSFLGQNSVSLTVTDVGGLSHTAYKTITVRDATGHFPCQSSINTPQLATCGQSNGKFSVNQISGEAFSLKNNNNQLITPSGTTYQNLAVGNYTLTFSSTDGCLNAFNLQIQADSSTCPNWKPKKCAMRIGMGISGLNYYNTERAFKDFFKQSSGEFLTNDNAANSNSWDSGVANEIVRDTSGYPLQIPQITSHGATTVRMMLSADGFVPPGNYLLLYDGVGDINIGGLGNSLVIKNANRYQITVPPGFNTNLWLDLVQSTLGNHVRNIRFIKTSDEATYLTKPFYQKYLDVLQQFAAIRFMDWGGTNGNQLVNWADRTKQTYRTQALSQGVAYEYMIELANTLQRDIWVNIPAHASDDYIQKMAQLFRQKLDPNLTIYVEYSNEVWNWQFEQANYVANNGPQHYSYPRRYVVRAVNAFRIFKQVFESGTSQAFRLKRVLGTQAGYAWVGEQILSFANQNDYDFLSPTWYFRYNDNDLSASSTAQDIVNATRNAWRVSSQTQEKQAYLLAKLYGKEVVNYEGGQHMTNSPMVMPWQQALYDAQIHPDMTNLYQEVIDSTRKWGSKMAVAFILASARQSRYGSWGHLEDIDQDILLQPAPKFSALINNVCSYTPCPDKILVENPIVGRTLNLQAKNFVTGIQSISNGSNVQFSGNTTVELKPGFSIQKGAVFKAEIRGCP